MKMILNIYQDGKPINTIISEDEKEIFKNIAQCYFIKEKKLATKTSIFYSSLSNLQKIIVLYNKDKTQTGHIYKYVYEFDEIKL